MTAVVELWLAAAIWLSPLLYRYSKRSALWGVGEDGWAFPLNWICLQAAARGVDLHQESARAGVGGDKVESLFCFILASSGVMRQFCNILLV